MPFIALSAGVPRPYEFPPVAQPGLERVANVTPLRPVAAQGDPGTVRSLAEYRRRGRDEGRPERRPAMVAADLMSHPVETLPEDASLAAARALIRLRGFRHLPVVSPEGVPVGILSDRDLFGSEGHTDGITRDLMRRELVTATPDTALPEIARVMVHERISALPIIGATRELVGILTTTDLLGAIVREAPLDLWT